MVTSGVATRKEIDLDFEDESESTVHVMVHDLKPPFLDGRTVFTKQLDPINPVRDPTSDMATFSRKGSALVKEKREQAERAKAAAKLAALGGTQLGNIMGVKDEEMEAEGKSFSNTFYAVVGLHIHVVSFSPFLPLPVFAFGACSCCRGKSQAGKGGRLQGRLEVRFAFEDRGGRECVCADEDTQGTEGIPARVRLS